MTDGQCDRGLHRVGEKEDGSGRCERDLRRHPRRRSYNGRSPPLKDPRRSRATRGCTGRFTIIASPPGRIVKLYFRPTVRGRQHRESPRITDMVFGALIERDPEADRRIVRDRSTYFFLRASRHRPRIAFISAGDQNRGTAGDAHFHFGASAGAPETGREQNGNNMVVTINGTMPNTPSRGVRDALPGLRRRGTACVPNRAGRAEFIFFFFLFLRRVGGERISGHGSGGDG